MGRIWETCRRLSQEQKQMIDNLKNDQNYKEKSDNEDQDGSLS